MTPRSAPDPFEAWRQAVRLEEGFPRLKHLDDPLPRRGKDGRELPTDDSRRLFLEGDLAEDAERVYESLGASRAILTSPGHGATTLARWAYHRARRDAIVRRAIPVVVSIEDLIDKNYEELVDAEARFLDEHHPDLSLLQFVDSDNEDAIEDFKDAADESAHKIFGHITSKLCRDAIEARVRFEIVRAIGTQPWERATGGPAYRDLLGLPAASPQAFEAARKDMSAVYERMPLGYLPPPDKVQSFWDTLRRLAPPLADTDYAQQIRDLNNSCGVRISLILDLSATPMGRQYLGDPRGPVGEEHVTGGEHLTAAYMEVLKNMAKAIKNIEQAGGRGPQPVLPSLLDKTYVMSEQAWPVFKAEFKQQEDERVPFSPYRPLDLFAVLAYHYPPEQNEYTGRRTELLAAVLDSAYLKLTPFTAISTEMVLLEKTIRADLNRRQAIPYQQRFRDESERNALRWAQQLWKCYVAGEREATAFLESVLSEPTLEKIRQERAVRDGDDGWR